MRMIDGPCIEWQGTMHEAGYGVVQVDGKSVRAHRHAWELANGPIPDGLVLDHLCRNRSCVNPNHLEPVTLEENILRGESPAAVNARKFHCDSGHEFTESNTRINPKGYRICKECSRVGTRERMRQLRARRAALTAALSKTEGAS